MLRKTRIILAAIFFVGITLQNNTKKDVRIGKQIPSCECITARYADEVIRPGESAEVMVVFSPSESIGRNYRSVELLDADGNTLGALSTKAQVVAKGGAEKYPFWNTDLSNEARVENLISLLTL